MKLFLSKLNFKQDFPPWESEALPYIYEQGRIAVENAKQRIIQAIELFPEHLNH